MLEMGGWEVIVLLNYALGDAIGWGRGLRGSWEKGGGCRVSGMIKYEEEIGNQAFCIHGGSCYGAL